MSKPTTFYDPEEALDLVMERAERLPERRIPLGEALGRYLPTAVSARLDQPRFRKALVDGYAVLPGQGEEPFLVMRTIAAGDAVDPGEPSGLSKGQAIRIMTGAVVPEDIERVLRFEYTEEVSPPSAPGRDGETPVVAARRKVQENPTNISEAGENILAGKPLLTPRILTALDIGILASQGYDSVSAVPSPRVTVHSTGSELRSPGLSSIPAWAIYDSNSALLTALAESAGATAINGGILADERAAITEAIDRAIQASDLVILSGGVSMGDLDLVPGAILELGGTIHFHGLAMKPGKPTLFATHGKTLIFGLPGNPVSTVAQFEIFLRPALHALQGRPFTPREESLPLGSSFSRERADRHEFLPGYLKEGRVFPIRYTGSGHLSAFAEAELFFRIDKGITTLDAGESVRVRYLREIKEEAG